MSKLESETYERYMVFRCYEYESMGGLEDVIGDFANEPEAREFADRERNSYNIVYIFDRVDGRLLYERPAT